MKITAEGCHQLRHRQGKPGRTRRVGVGVDAVPGETGPAMKARVRGQVGRDGVEDSDGCSRHVC